MPLELLRIAELLSALGAREVMLVRGHVVMAKVPVGVDRVARWVGYG